MEDTTNHSRGLHTQDGRHPHGHHDPGGHQPHGQHEKTDLEVVAVTKYGIGILLGTVFTMVLVAFLYFQADSYFKANAVKVEPMVQADPQKEPPEPRLLSNEPANLKKVREGEAEILNTYGWVDPDNGKVRIPVARAMELVAREGLPSKVAPATSAPVPATPAAAPAATPSAKPAEAAKH